LRHQCNLWHDASTLSSQQHADHVILLEQYKHPRPQWHQDSLVHTNTTSACRQLGVATLVSVFAQTSCNYIWKHWKVYLELADGHAKSLGGYASCISCGYCCTNKLACLKVICLFALQILPAGASKGKGVDQLLKHLDVKPERVLAMGDGENDKVMLQVWVRSV
jgi:hypothetical protein